LREPARTATARAVAAVALAVGGVAVAATRSLPRTGALNGNDAPFLRRSPRTPNRRTVRVARASPRRVARLTALEQGGGRQRSRAAGASSPAGGDRRFRSSQSRSGLPNISGVRTASDASPTAAEATRHRCQRREGAAIRRKRSGIRPALRRVGVLARTRSPPSAMRPPQLGFTSPRESLPPVPGKRNDQVPVPPGLPLVPSPFQPANQARAGRPTARCRSTTRPTPPVRSSSRGAGLVVLRLSTRTATTSARGWPAGRGAGAARGELFARPGKWLPRRSARRESSATAGNGYCFR
jgi:hypothetical protein